MPFDIDWKDTAVQELADIWLASSNRNALSKAEAEINKLLISDPTRHGSIVREDLWRIVRSPLRVFFELNLDEKTVYVTSVKSTP